MATWKILRVVNGIKQAIAGLTASAGASDSGAIPALDATGRLDMTFMPVGVQQERKILSASEALSAGNYVNIYDAAGTTKCRKADASSNKPANGFVLSVVNQDENATVFLEGTNTGLSALTGGKTYFVSKTTPGGVTDDVSAFTTNDIVQQVGHSLSATEISTELSQPITLV